MSIWQPFLLPCLSGSFHLLRASSVDFRAACSFAALRVTFRTTASGQFLCSVFCFQ